MPKDNHQNSQVCHVKLFVSSDCELCDQAEDYLQQWSENKPEVKTETVSVLQSPEEVVRLQIFYTPALVIDGEVIVKQNLSVTEIEELLAG